MADDTRDVGALPGPLCGVLAGAQNDLRDLPVRVPDGDARHRCAVRHGRGVGQGGHGADMRDRARRR